MRLTPLGKLVVVAVLLIVVWKFLSHSDLVMGVRRSLFRAEPTPIDVMVFIAIGFVALLVFLGRSRSPGASSL